MLTSLETARASSFIFHLWITSVTLKLKSSGGDVTLQVLSLLELRPLCFLIGLFIQVLSELSFHRMLTLNIFPNLVSYLFLHGNGLQLIRVIILLLFKPVTLGCLNAS